MTDKLEVTRLHEANDPCTVKFEEIDKFENEALLDNSVPILATFGMLSVVEFTTTTLLDISNNDVCGHNFEPMCIRLAEV